MGYKGGLCWVCNMGVQNDVWKAVDDKRPEGMRQHKWRHSHAGIEAALAHKGYELITTQEELDNMAVPRSSLNKACFMYRKVAVTRNGLQSSPTSISGLLSGNSGLLTMEELTIVRDSVSADRIAAQPKGVTLNNDKESLAVDDLDAMIQIEQVLYREHLMECRLADIAYAVQGSDLASEVYVADQVKTSRVAKNGVLTMHHGGYGKVLKVGSMIGMLKKSMSLTCIGLTAVGDVSVVWFFADEGALAMLSTFDTEQNFCPVLKLKKKSLHPFTMAYNSPEFRFDVGASADECARLRQRKLDHAVNGVKRTLLYLNEDDSQIPSEGNRRELASMKVTRDACKMIGASVVRLHEDANGAVDFRVRYGEYNVKIQDKAIGQTFSMRNEGKHPYNPDTIDVLQTTLVEERCVYAIPMRMMKDSRVVSTFSEADLMKKSIRVTCEPWRIRFAAFHHDLNTDAGRRSYLAACVAAVAVPSLSDRDFYKNMLKNNALKIGSKRQLKERANAAAA